MVDNLLLNKKEATIAMDEKIGVEITSAENVTVMAFKAASVCGGKEIATATEQIHEFIKEEHPCKIVFDFEQVKFFSSQVLGMLLDMRAKMDLYNGEVVISGINPQLYRVFKITNLDKIFRFFPDKKTAVNAVSATS